MAVLLSYGQSADHPLQAPVMTIHFKDGSIPSAFSLDRNGIVRDVMPAHYADVYGGSVVKEPAKLQPGDFVRYIQQRDLKERETGAAVAKVEGLL